MNLSQKNALQLYPSVGELARIKPIRWRRRISIDIGARWHACSCGKSIRLISSLAHDIDTTVNCSNWDECAHISSNLKDIFALTNAAQR